MENVIKMLKYNQIFLRAYKKCFKNIKAQDGMRFVGKAARKIFMA